MRQLRYVLLAALVWLLAGCGKNADGTGDFRLYYLDSSETKIEESTFSPEESAGNALVSELVDALKEEPPQSGSVALLPQDVQIQSFGLDGGTLTLNLTDAYLDMEHPREVLVRAGLVRTFVQVPEVSRVSIEVDGHPLLDSYGAQIGPLGADSFIENAGREINEYQYAMLTLYFADESGTKLVPETRNVTYSTSVPLERVVVEQLIRGPKEEGHYAVLTGTTNILGVTTSEQITYVNFDRTFADSTLAVSEELPIYAVVDSITANCKVDRVQFSINGESDVTFRETMKLNQFYEEDLSYLEEEDE